MKKNFRINLISAKSSFAAVAFATVAVTCIGLWKEPSYILWKGRKGNANHVEVILPLIVVVLPYFVVVPVMVLS